MKIAVCDDDKNCLDSIKRLLAEYPGISRIEYYQELSQFLIIFYSADPGIFGRIEYYQELSQLSEALENGTTYFCLWYVNI